MIEVPTGADKGRYLIEFIAKTWEETGRPRSERAVERVSTGLPAEQIGMLAAAARIAARDFG